ncbi:MBL fold metallo-hydrolase [Thioalkalicoccus limnaeus]|uniref:MBL fold metallo-hydrolase n=1 Tax=Thioalkalicoccus limnaeus TaxID=120681 RepID=A0ABV4BBW9_9GAMM
MIFRQLFEPVSSTYTYLLGCPDTGQAILIDPVLPTWQRDLAELSRLSLKLVYTLDTHIHADHITAARKLRDEAQSRIAHPAIDALPCADLTLEEGTPLMVGSLRIDPLFTPGHTDGHHAYRFGDRVFTGDALLIEACGRTDFQNGDAPTLYRSVHDKLFTLPDETLVYPAHDYEGRFITSIAQEKQRNPRLGGDRPLAEFVEIMDNLKLAYPKFIDYAVPGNRECGQCPAGVPDDLMQYCEQIGESRQG